MSYSVLRVVEAGIPLYSEHERRFARAGAAATFAFRAFASDAAPGIYRATWDGQRLEVERRDSVSLHEGIAVRYLPSPIAALGAQIEKAPAPNEYAAVRVPGIATLLTSADGEEIYESCTAAVVEWDDGFIAPPQDRPRLISSTLATLLKALPMRTAPIRVDSIRPLCLLNAVSGLVEPAIPGRARLPSEARALFQAQWEASTRRP